MEVLLYQDKKNKVEEKEKNQYATFRTHSSWTVLNERRSPRLLPRGPRQAPVFGVSPVSSVIAGYVWSAVFF